MLCKFLHYRILLIVYNCSFFVFVFFLVLDMRRKTLLLAPSPLRRSPSAYYPTSQLYFADGQKFLLQK